ncbi:hypothetical protein [Streptomyces sp. NPDC057877]|uniref:hypothetical protein n=1 Tax=Streptomyces sp. NPDC057877 TaxID=3346269 RepID=UPI00369ADE79
MDSEFPDDRSLDHYFLRFPRAALAIPDRALREITAVPLGPDSPLTRLAFTYFSHLSANAELQQGGHADAAVER